MEVLAWFDEVADGLKGDVFRRCNQVFDAQLELVTLLDTGATCGSLPEWQNGSV